MARRAFSIRALPAAGNVKHVQDTARVLGLKHLPSSELELADLASRGFPGSTLSNLSGALGWSQAALVQQLGIAPRTAARRLTSRRPLSVSESERALRLARVLAKATEIFESRDSAKAWLVEKNAALGARTPLDLIATEIGAEIVFNELGKIDHGFFA
jgi:putative toxin-antitoxin system antitoxin component (TIGR02293 family)